MRKVFLDDLPKSNGKGANKNKIVIDWSKSIGYKIKFIYDNIEGVFEILSYSCKKSYLIVKYKKKALKVYTQRLINNKFENIIKEEIFKFKYKIGERLVDENRDIIIIDRKIKIINRKSKNTIKGLTKRNIAIYKYKCYKCGFDCGKHWNVRDEEYKEEYWVEESNLLKGQGCGVCCPSSHKIVENINSIPTTAPWMVKYFQGGYDEAKLYSVRSSKKIYPVCPDCGRVKNKKISISNIYISRSIGCTCSDKISYGEKFTFSVLEQLNLDFQTQLTKTIFKWCGKYKYDFYFELNNKKYIIETHGIQHYERGFSSCGGQTVEEVQKNDELKKELALKNGIKKENYIVIDCKRSELDFIKQNILKSKLSELFDLSDIDWVKSGEYACSNLVKKACEMKNNNPTLNCQEIGILMGNIYKGTVYNWLKQGNGIWCNYIAKEERDKARNKSMKTNKKLYSKSTGVFKNETCIGIFESAAQLSRMSMSLFNVKLYQGTISSICRGLKSKYKGYTFKYIDDLILEEYIKYDIENKLKELHNRELVQAV